LAVRSSVSPKIEQWPICVNWLGGEKDRGISDESKVKRLD
jgi:hypothetical protein